MAPTNGNTYVFDPESAAEMARLINVDQIITRAMGGPLAEQKDLNHVEHILDIGCGPGGWLLDVAHAFPHVQGVGIDISDLMVRYANARAISELLDNVSFEVMNALEPLAISDRSFDLINARFMSGFLPRQKWSSLLTECMRLLRPGGVIRMTEADIFGITTSPACERLNRLFMQFSHQAGYGFSVDGATLGITPMLEPLLRQAGYTQIGLRAHALSFPVGSPTWAIWHENSLVAYIQIADLLAQTGQLSAEEARQLWQQAQVEMEADTFSGTMLFLTVWGYKPASQEEIP